MRRREIQEKIQECKQGEGKGEWRGEGEERENLSKVPHGAFAHDYTCLQLSCSEGRGENLMKRTKTLASQHPLFTLISPPSPSRFYLHETMHLSSIPRARLVSRRVIRLVRNGKSKELNSFGLGVSKVNKT